MVVLGGKRVDGVWVLGQEILRNMKTQSVFCDPQPGPQLEQPASMSDDDLIQASFQQLKNPLSPARPRLLQDTVQWLMMPRGRLSLVTGQAGQGKTAFLV